MRLTDAVVKAAIGIRTEDEAATEDGAGEDSPALTTEAVALSRSDSEYSIGRMTMFNSGTGVAAFNKQNNI